MSVQKSILSFFKPGGSPKLKTLKEIQNSPCKRFKTSSDVTDRNKNDNVNANDDCVNSQTSNKTDELYDKNNLSGSTVLTGDVTDAPVYSEEKKEIEKRRLAAKLKLLSKKFPILDPGMDPTWVATLEKELNKPYFQKLNDFIMGERKNKTIFPPPDQVWTWTKLCPLEETKVVIIGQDPYHNPKQAHGLCFSVPVGVAIPPSLQNIYKELEANYPGIEIPKHGHLMGWGMQGVLLLNAVLTVEANKPNSHKDKGWEQVTSAVIKYLNDNFTGLVFLLWGSYAQKKADFVDQKKHYILKSVHPSPLSAHRGFFGCKHFLKCNELLSKQKLMPINWEWLPRSEDTPDATHEVELYSGPGIFDSRQEELIKDFREDVTSDFRF